MSALTPVIIFVTSAIPPRSAPMLKTFATIRRKQALHNIQRGQVRRKTPARPRPVTIPKRAHIIWTADIRGNEKRAVHNGAYPNKAPVTEYVDIPEGSSSAAPVIRPGPRSAKKSRTRRGETSSATFLPALFTLSVTFDFRFPTGPLFSFRLPYFVHNIGQ